MNYIGIATRNYGMGRICVSSDRISGYRSGHGNSSSSFWRKMLEWVGQKQAFDTIKIAAIVSVETNYENRLLELSPVYVETIDFNDIVKMNLSRFDLIYFVGTPTDSSVDVKTTIANYVQNGGGVLIETPNDGVIEIIENIDSINVDSMQRPSHNKAYWTKSGILHPCYVPDLNISMMVSIGLSQFDYNWNILLSDVETNYGTTSYVSNTNFTASNSMISEFGVSVGTYMKDGVVLIEEGNSDQSSESTSSSESTGNTSQTSSSSSNIIEWDVCDNVVAQWKMNDQRLNSIIVDSTNNLNNMGTLYRGTSQRNSNLASTGGKIDKGISFNGQSDFIVTAQSEELKFNNGQDESFAFSGWIKTNSNIGTIICKKNVWEIGIENQKVYFVRYDDYGKSKKIVTLNSIDKNKWHHIVVNADITSPSIVVNLVPQLITTVDDGYSELNTQVSETYIGWSGKNQRMYVSANGLWKRSPTTGNSDPNGEAGQSATTEACYSSSKLNSSLLPIKSFRLSSLLCFFEDFDGKLIYVNGSAIHFVGKNFEITLPSSVKNAVFGFHDKYNWSDNTGNSSVNISWEHGSSQNITVPSTASLYFRWANNSSTVTAIETVEDFTGNWVDLASNLRPVSVQVPQQSPFDGVLDNFIVTDRLLTAPEIEALFNNGSGTEECQGVYQYQTSSSSSSSSIDSSSSSSSLGTSSSSSLGTSSSSSSYGYSTSSSSSSTSLSSLRYSSSTSSTSGSSRSSVSSFSSETSSSSTDNWFIPVVPGSAWATNYSLMSDRVHDGVIPTTVYPVWEQNYQNVLLANVGVFAPGIGVGGWSPPFIWTMDFGTVAYVINSYAIHIFNIGWGNGPYYPPDIDNAPKSWTFEGSNDNSNWTVLDTRTDVNWTNRTYRMFRNIGNYQAYRLYRFRFTAKVGGSIYFGISEIRLG